MAHRDDGGGGYQELFLATLLLDVSLALEMQSERLADRQANRRALIRTLFAAIEGFAWAFREHVRSAAQTVGVLTPEQEMALSEVSYHVSEQGKVSTQPRFLSMPAAIRLTSNIAMTLDPQIGIRFDTSDWDGFRRAMEIRNRLTHPKEKADLVIDAADVSASLAAFHWLLELCVRAMESANLAVARHRDELRQILDSLKSEDPGILLEYQAALSRLQD